MMAKLFITQVMMKVPDLREAEDVKGYTDVGKGKGYWWRKRPKPSPTSQTCPQPISSPTSVTNIDVDDGKAGDRGRNNLCTPFKHDIRCASLCGVKFVVTKERREKRAQRESCLKGVRSLQASLPDRTGPYLNGQSYHPAAWLMPYVGKNNLWVDDWE